MSLQKVFTGMSRWLQHRPQFIDDDDADDDTNKHIIKPHMHFSSVLAVRGSDNCIGD
jgi:hypothetical protein